MHFNGSFIQLIACWSAIALLKKSFDVKASMLLRGRTDENHVADITTAASTIVKEQDSSDSSRELTTNALGMLDNQLGPSTRIVNGQNAPPDRFPWFVRILGPKDEQGFMTACGASLIARDMVISAAHCE
jgi:hypothetical protein